MSFLRKQESRSRRNCYSHFRWSDREGIIIGVPICYEVMKTYMNTQEIVQRMVTQEGIKQEFELTLVSHVDRYLKFKPHGIIPLTEFAAGRYCPSVSEA